VAITAESLLLAAAHVRARRPLPRWIAFDVVFSSAAIARARPSPRAGRPHLVHFMYPFSLISRSPSPHVPELRTVTGLTVILSVSYGASAVALHTTRCGTCPQRGQLLRQHPRRWAIARQLRQSGCEADESRALAVAQARNSPRNANAPARADAA